MRQIPRSTRAVVRRLARMLPEPRDEAFLSLATATRDLATGRRPTASPEAERLAVELGWLLVDVYERLGIEEARQVFGHELDAWFDYSRSTVHNLEPWDAGPTGLSIYENDNNRLRFRRTLDFVRPGDRVFDVGFGRGYLCGLLIRDGEIAAYHGVDVVPGYVDITRKMLAANDMEDREVGLELGNLFELRQARVARTAASLVICCEVLEHVDDPEAALAALAAALPKGTDLLFSVPIHGRLESVWGHVTVFDVARLKAMVENAGLFAHHVEPVANTWTMVVASRDSKPNRRVQASKWRIVANASTPLVEDYDFVQVNPSGMAPAKGLNTNCVVEPSPQGATCHVTSKLPDDPEEVCRGGLAFSVEGLNALRVDIGLLDFGHVEAVDVDLYARQHLGRWTWHPTPAQVANRDSRRYAMRYGLSSSPFRAHGFKRDGRVQRVEVTIEVRAGESAAFTFRAAYLPG
jgi:2-polyprenyl-3-methyl-5-hydroxy-6-metoxy-1,4-benzoquinol methylase